MDCKYKSTKRNNIHIASLLILGVFYFPLFSQTNPYKSDIVSWDSMQMLNGPVKAIAAGGFHTVALIDADATGIKTQKKLLAPNKTVQVKSDGLLFLPHNSHAVIFNIKGSIVAQLNAGSHNLNQYTIGNDLLIIKVSGEINQILKYGKISN